MQPGLLHRIVRLGERAEHAISDRAQARPVCLELRCQPVVLVHRSHSPAAIRHSTDGGKTADVTKTPAGDTNQRSTREHPSDHLPERDSAPELRPDQDLRYNAELGLM